MNSQGRIRSHASPLKLCPACGMDGAVRRFIDDGGAEEKHFVQCDVCGFKTRICHTARAAARAWNKYKRA